MGATWDQYHFDGTINSPHIVATIQEDRPDSSGVAWDSQREYFAHEIVISNVILFGDT